MRRKPAVAALVIGTLTIVGLMALFASQLANNQSASRHNLEAQAHQRAVLVANLVDTLFGAISKPGAATTAQYGRPHVSPAMMNRNRGGNLYVALFDTSGHILAASRGVTAQARSELTVEHSAALRLTVAGNPWALGNILPYGKASVINFGVRVATPAGTRIVVSGIPTAGMSPFLLAELSRVPAVRGAFHSMLDGNGVVIASTNPHHPPGYRFHTGPQLHVLSHGSGVINDHYFDQIALPHTTWKLLLSAPAGTFFASVSGQRHWLPWIIFAAFGLFALVALILAVREILSSAALADAHNRLELAHQQLEFRPYRAGRQQSGARAVQRRAGTPRPRAAAVQLRTGAVRVDCVPRPAGAAAQGPHIHRVDRRERGRQALRTRPHLPAACQRVRSSDAAADRGPVALLTRGHAEPAV